MSLVLIGVKMRKPSLFCACSFLNADRDAVSDKNISSFLMFHRQIVYLTAVETGFFFQFLSLETSRRETICLF